MSKKDTLSKLPKQKSEDDPNNQGVLLRGLPGYRTRAGRSGYDPIDTRAEAAHTAGTIIHKLFAARISNPISLFLLGVMGLALVTPLVIAISEVVNGARFPLDAWILFLAAGAAGLAIIINFIRNLIKNLFR
jgi:hypothetical protein